MATLFALERVHTYGRHVICETDHRPLLSITKKALSTAPTRLQRMLLRLQRYSICKLILPDTLNRACPPNNSDTAGINCTNRRTAIEWYSISAYDRRVRCSRLHRATSLALNVLGQLVARPRMHGCQYIHLYTEFSEHADKLGIQAHHVVIELQPS